MIDEPANRQDHDQRFKSLLREFVGPFFELFWPDKAALLDFSQVEWLENEAFPDPPEGRRRSLDLVCKVALREPIATAKGEAAAGMVVILHVEIESADTVEPFRRRMFQYFACLRQKYTDPILPVAIYLRVGLDGLGVDHYEERLGDFEVLRYNYLYVGLPALNAAEYLQTGRALAAALSAAMAIPSDRRPEYKAEGLRHVSKSNENEYRKFLLTEFVQAYLPLVRAEEQAAFENLLQTEKYVEVKTMVTTWYEQGLEAGLKQGRLTTILEVMETRFGPLPETLRERLEACPEEKYSELLRRSLQAHSLEDLRFEEFLD